MNDWKHLRMGELMAGIPIIQGGMGVGVSISGLASAVANQGGIGVIAAAGIGMLEPDGFSNFLEANVRALRQRDPQGPGDDQGNTGRQHHGGPV